VALILEVDSPRIVYPDWKSITIWTGSAEVRLNDLRFYEDFEHKGLKRIEMSNLGQVVALIVKHDGYSG